MIYKPVQIDNYLKKKDAQIRAVLLYGQNEGLIAEYVKKLVLSVSADAYDPFSVVYLNWDDVKTDVGILVSEFNSQSLMMSRRVIVLRDADNNFTKVLDELMQSSKSDTLLVISGSSTLNGKSSLVNLANGSEQIVSVACYEDRDENIISSVKAILIEKGITFSSDALSFLCSRLSNDRKFNTNEIEKLITYVGTKKHFDIDDVKAVVFDQAVSGVDDLCFYVFSGVKFKALNSLKYLLNEGVEEVQIIRSLIRHTNKLLEGKALIDKGEAVTSAVKKVFPKNMFHRYDMGSNQMTCWTKDRLFDVVELLYRAERDCKTTNIPTVEMLSYTILTLLSAANKLIK